MKYSNLSDMSMCKNRWKETTKNTKPQQRKEVGEAAERKGRDAGAV